MSVHRVVYLREKGERDGGTWCRCSCILQKDHDVLAEAATRTVQTRVNTALLQPRSLLPLYQGSNMIIPFILRRSLTTPFFSSARSHTVRTSILGQFLKRSPARSTSSHLQRPVRQASTLQLVEAPSILKFVPNGVWRARVPQYGRARDPFRGPPPPNGFWQRLKQQINSINPQFVLWGILGLNGAVFATWYVATANAVCVLISISMRMLQSDHCREWVTRNYTYGFMRTSSPVGVTSSKADSKYLSSSLGKFEFYVVYPIRTIFHSWTVLTCTISHQEMMHMLFNCLTFYWMAPPVLALLGNARFIALYFGSKYIHPPLYPACTSDLHFLRWNPLQYSQLILECQPES